MSTHRRRSAIRLVVLLPLVTAAVLLGPFAEQAAAETNISGTWNLTLNHPDVGGAIPCNATILQSGSAIYGSMTCTGLGSGGVSGTIDTATGAFTLSGHINEYTMNISGTGAADGSSMMGTFTLPPVPGQGTFTGTRTGAAVVGGSGARADLRDASFQPDSSGANTTAVLGAILGAALVCLAFALYAAVRHRRQRAS